MTDAAERRDPPFTGAARPRPLDRRLTSLIACAAVVAVCTLLADLHHGPRPIDDAFITLRYARSLAEGQGFVYNPGEPVLGTTTPLFAMLVALLHAALGADYVNAAFGLSVAAHAAAAMVLVSCGWASGELAAGTVAGLLAAMAQPMVATSAGCMETTLFILLMLLALMPQRPRGATVAAGLAVLVRPEGVLVAGLHIVRLAIERPQRVWRAVLIIGALVVPWIVFAIWYFGTPLPNSMAMKWRAGSTVRDVIEAFWAAMVGVVLNAPPLLRPGTLHPWQFAGIELHSSVSAVLLNLITGVAMLIVVATGARELMRQPRGRWLVVFLLMYVGSFVAARPIFFPWYAIPILPVAALVGAVGVVRVTRGSSPPARQIIVVAVACAVLALAARQTVRVSADRSGEREAKYREIVGWLGPLAQDPSTLIAAVEVGTVGYYSRARMLDLCGLVSPEMATLSMAQAVQRFQPAAVVGAPIGFSDVERSPEFTRRYQLVGSLPWEVSPLLRTNLYARRDVLLPLHREP